MKKIYRYVFLMLLILFAICFFTYCGDDKKINCAETDLEKHIRIQDSLFERLIRYVDNYDYYRSRNYFDSIIDVATAIQRDEHLYMAILMRNRTWTLSAMDSIIGDCYFEPYDARIDSLIGIYQKNVSIMSSKELNYLAVFYDEFMSNRFLMDKYDEINR